MLPALFLTIPIPVSAGTQTTSMCFLQAPNAHLPVPCLHGSLCLEYPLQSPFCISTCSPSGKAQAMPSPHHIPPWRLEVLSPRLEVLSTKSALLSPHPTVSDWPGAWHRAGAKKCFREEEMGAHAAVPCPWVLLALGVRILSSHTCPPTSSQGCQPAHTLISGSISCCLSCHILRIGDSSLPGGLPSPQIRPLCLS